MKDAELCMAKSKIPFFFCICNQMLKARGSPKSPRDVAQEIVANLEFAESFIDKVSE